jgi:hypothetical protein
MKQFKVRFCREVLQYMDLKVEAESKYDIPMMDLEDRVNCDTADWQQSESVDDPYVLSIEEVAVEAQKA